MIISIASGKGGTGKTTVSVNLALALDNTQLIDCDVEEPNAHIFLKPEITATETVTVPVPAIDLSKCSYCGTCAEVCVYRAINIFTSISSGNEVLLLPHLCHNCGACSILCPQQAITEQQKSIGTIETGRAGCVDYASGKLDIGEPKSPPLIKQLKKKINREKTVILDCPPGTSCPMMTAVKGSDFCLLVTEPTPFGLHDLNLAVETVKKLGIRFGVFVNRATDSRLIEDYCSKSGAPFLGGIPFDREIARLYSEGDMFLKAKPQYRSVFHDLVGKITKLTEGEPHGN